MGCCQHYPRGRKYETHNVIAYINLSQCHESNGLCCISCATGTSTPKAVRRLDRLYETKSDCIVSFLKVSPHFHQKKNDQHQGSHWIAQEIHSKC